MSCEDVKKFYQVLRLVPFAPQLMPNFVMEISVKFFSVLIALLWVIFLLLVLRFDRRFLVVTVVIGLNLRRFLVLGTITCCIMVLVATVGYLLVGRYPD